MKRAALAMALAVALGGCSEVIEPSPFAARVAAFERGANAGFGADKLPGVVLGPPRGGGETTGSLDVVSLGAGGVITLELGSTIVDGPGVDLVVFENPFRYAADALFLEPGEVSVSDDGVSFVAFPCVRAAPYSGCAGLHTVQANAETNAIDPLVPGEAGGDGFDLAAIGVSRARYVRIVDIERGPDVFVGSGGFDLDAVAAISVE